MTSKELQGLGLTDDILMAEYERLTGVRIDLRANPASAAERRRMIFRDVTQDWYAVSAPVGTAPIGAFSTDAPDVHAAIANP